MANQLDFSDQLLSDYGMGRDPHTNDDGDDSKHDREDSIQLGGNSQVGAGGKVAKEMTSPVRPVMMRKVLREIQRVDRKLSRGSARGSNSGFVTTAAYQRTVVKAQYRDFDPAEALADRSSKSNPIRYGDYLQRDTAPDGERLMGFNDKKDNVNITQDIEKWCQEGDGRVWNFVISPEHGSQVDLRKHAREFMEQVKTELSGNDGDFQMEWNAIVHREGTDNDHVHINLRGRDPSQRDGKLSIDKNFLGQKMRRISSTLLTQELGYRSEKEIKNSREMEIGAKKFTSLDRELVEMVRAQNSNTIQVSKRGLRPGTPQYEQRSHLLSRLEVLEKMGLATYQKKKNTYTLDPAMASILRNYSKNNDLTKRKALHEPNFTNPNLELRNTVLKQGEKLTGRLVSIGISDDISTDSVQFGTKHGTHFIMVEGADGAAHSITVSRAVAEQYAAKDLQVGDLVTVEGRSFEKEIVADDKGPGRKELVLYAAVTGHKALEKMKAAELGQTRLDVAAMEMVNSSGRLPPRPSSQVPADFSSAYDHAVRERAHALAETPLFWEKQAGGKFVQRPAIQLSESGRASVDARHLTRVKTAARQFDNDIVTMEQLKKSGVEFYDLSKLKSGVVIKGEILHIKAEDIRGQAVAIVKGDKANFALPIEKSLQGQFKVGERIQATRNQLDAEKVKLTKELADGKKFVKTPRLTWNLSAEAGTPKKEVKRSGPAR